MKRLAIAVLLALPRMVAVAPGALMVRRRPVRAGTGPAAGYFICLLGDQRPLLSLRMVGGRS